MGGRCCPRGWPATPLLAKGAAGATTLTDLEWENHLNRLGFWGVASPLPKALGVAEPPQIKKKKKKRFGFWEVARPPPKALGVARPPPDRP